MCSWTIGGSGNRYDSGRWETTPITSAARVHHAPQTKARLEKELNNKVNRRVNCDGANISKVVDAAQVQLAAIRVLRDRGQFDKLPLKLQQAALAREAEPEASLTELAQMMDPPITKPAMNNRMKKLMKLAEEGTV